MYSIPNKFNRFIISLFVIAPFVAFFSLNYLKMDFLRAMQFLSYIGVFLVLVFSNKTRPLKFPKYLLFYLLFILYVFHSAFVQLDRDFKIVYLFSNRLIGAFNFMLIIENLTISKKHFNLLLKYSKIVLVIAFVTILIQQAVNKFFFVRTDLIYAASSVSGSEDRLYSIYSWVGINSSGYGFVPIFILIIEYLESKKKKILTWIFIGIIFAILTKARWIMLNTLLVFVVLFVNHKDKAKQFLKYLFILPVILTLSFFAMNSVGINATKILEDRILESDKKDISQKSAGTRLLAFTVFNKLFWDQPFFGKGSIKYGMGGTGKQDYRLKKELAGHSSQLHVGYLSVLYMYGLIGGFFFIGFIYFILRKLYKDAKFTGFWAPFLGVLGFAVANLTLVTFSLFEMGFIVVLVANKYYCQNSKLRKRVYA